MKKLVSISISLLLMGNAFATDAYRVTYTLQGLGKKATVLAESSQEARRVVMDLFPGAVVTGAFKVK